ncbi:MAG: hypothetical protein WBG36_13195 [Ornithinimicrobium sp.]
MPVPRRVAITLVLVLLAGVAGLFGARWVSSALSDPVCEFRLDDRTERKSPEQSANAATMGVIAVQRGLPPRAATLAIATAIQESKLRNITYGDADSIGLFQQRPSQGWGSEEEILDPVYATNQFYDALIEVPGWQDGVITEVAQSVQRSAYPAAYADHEWEGRVMASTLTGQTPASMGCDLDAAEDPGDPAGVAASLQALGMGASSDGTRVTVQANSSESAWSAATWAVANAESRAVVAVSVDGRTWSRDEDPLTWSEGGDAEAGETTVIITVAN